MSVSRLGWNRKGSWEISYNFIGPDWNIQGLPLRNLNLKETKLDITMKCKLHLDNIFRKIKRERENFTENNDTKLKKFHTKGISLFISHTYF